MLRTATILFFVCLMIETKAQPILESLAKSEMMRYDKLTRANTKRSNQGNVDIRFATLSFEPDMSNADILSASVHYIFKTDASITNIEFDLRKELTVDSVIYHGLPLVFVHDNTHLLKINFPTAINAGTRDSLSIYYHGATNTTSRAYYRAVTVSGASISTLSEPYSSHFWWPCRENLHDKIDSLNVNLTVDTPYVAVSNGKLASTSISGGKRIFRFEHRYPIATYLVAVSFAKYNFYIQQAFLPSVNQSLDIRNYVFLHTDLADAKNKTLETVRIMRLYDSLFGTYPFYKEHYGHAQYAWGGGMEHQTMSFMANLSYDLIAHELGHQWFGDKVTCGTWKDLWLNESFATYSNLLCYDFLRTETEWIDILKKFKTEVMVLPYGSVYKNDTSDVGIFFDYRTTYQKGAMVLHQLRWVLGDDIFFKAIRKYLNDANLAYKFVRKGDLRAYFELESGMQLGDYFNDWINLEGYPEYDISWTQKGKELAFEIVQTQSHPSVNLFNVPLPLLVKGANRDTMLRVDILTNYQTYNIMLDFKVKEVIFDPEEWVLAKYKIRFPFSDDVTITTFPNPFNGFLYISLDDIDISGWEIVDATGKLVLSQSYETPLQKGVIEKIDCNFLADGVYLIKINGNDRTMVRKIVKN